MKSKLLLIACILFVTIVTIVTIVLIVLISNGLPSHHPGPSPNHPVAELYLILEAPGFNVPELIKTQQIMVPSVAQSNFDKVIVMANTARYSDSNTGRKILTDQWDNKLVTALGLPVEKWAFVCCNSTVPAETMVNNLISNFPDIKGFLIDSEDDAGSVDAFVKTFKSKGSAYKYGIIGGLRKGVPPGVFGKFFSEVYTEVTNNIAEEDQERCLVDLGFLVAQTHVGAGEDEQQQQRRQQLGGQHQCSGYGGRHSDLQCVDSAEAHLGGREEHLDVGAWDVAELLE